jgi:heme exporter protein D
MGTHGLYVWLVLPAHVLDMIGTMDYDLIESSLMIANKVIDTQPSSRI